MPDDKQPETPPDPVELVVKAVPRQLWVAIGAVAVALLAILFVDLGHLAGLGSEEAGFLAHLGQIQVNLRGVLLGGIVVGAVGSHRDTNHQFDSLSEIS